MAVVEALSFDEPKTSVMAGVLKSLGLAGKRTLLVIDKADENMLKSCRNLANLKLVAAHQLNAYELLHAEQVLLTADGLARVREVFVR